MNVRKNRVNKRSAREVCETLETVVESRVHNGEWFTPSHLQLKGYPDNWRREGGQPRYRPEQD